MGWHINYEIEFADHIDWDDDVVKGAIYYHVNYLYLRDLEKPRVIMCIYSQSPIEDILNILKVLYRTDMRYRVYGTQEWISFTV